jgi:phosphoglycolate phosphatase
MEGESVLTEFDVVMFDCDGVLYQSNQVLEGAIETVSALRDRNVQVKFVTNSSTKSREKLFDKLRDMGFESIKIDDCYTSGFCAAQYLGLHLPDVRKVYVIGEEGLVKELQRVGLEVVGGPQDNEKHMNDALFIKLGDSGEFENIDAVVVGYDQSFNYYKLAVASLCFQQNRNCILIATNQDQHDRIGGKWLIPVNGCGVAAVVHAVNNLDGQRGPVEPLVFGKPNALFGKLVLETSGLSDVPPERVLMVGDKIETDIQLARNCGFKSCLVLSGCVKGEDLKGERPADIVLNGLFDVANVLNR